MADDDDDDHTLAYETPAKIGGTARGGFSPWLGLVVAPACLVATQFIWMGGPFGHARRDALAMVIVLCVGAVVSFACCVAGFRRYDSGARMSGRQALGCLLGLLLGVLNLAAGCFLAYWAVGIWRGYLV